VTIRRGKGGKCRVVPSGSQTAVAIDRYLRQARAGHPLASTSETLWLGDRGKPFAYDGLHKSLKLRAELAGINGFHPYRRRHSAAHRWLAAGGSEGGLRCPSTGPTSTPLSCTVVHDREACPVVRV
jgi:integrase/recombinase XerD